MTSFGRTLRLLLRRAGMSQPDLAAKVFVSQPTISRFESGDRMPDPALAGLLDEALAAGGRAGLPRSGRPGPRRIPGPQAGPGGQGDDP
ncbi:helix-turn-helix domain-containing protein [Streptomyces albireticuli]